MPDRSPSLTALLADHYARIFTRPWPVIPCALVIAALNVFLFAYDRPWTASDGLRNWGDWILRLSGMRAQADLLPPWLYSGSLLNFGLLWGAFAAALLSREFAPRGAPAPELFKGGVGGLLMGAGAMLAFGCNVGGFFSATAALSLSGPGMMAGLAGGGYLATRYLIHENARLIRAGKMPFSACEAPGQIAPMSPYFVAQPLAGAGAMVVLLAGAYFYQQSGYGPQGTFLLFGAALGVIFQRSRFCLVRAFREPFMSGESEHVRAAALAVVLSLAGFAILKSTDLKDAGDWVFPSFWLGAVSGGALFGIGMVLAGGCGAGSIWRAGEGHLKLWVALVFFALGASMTRAFLLATDLIGQLGSAVFLPSAIGWRGALWSVVGLMLAWYLWAVWNEQRKQAGVLHL